MAKFSGVADVKNTLRGAREGNTIVGGNLADRLYGNAYIDIFYGGAGNDYIYGGNGSNIFYGEAGNDTMIGGSDSDNYTVDVNEGNDIIIDRGGRNSLFAYFITTATSGVFIKRGNDLIVAEGTENNLSAEIAAVQAMGTLAERRAGMRTVVNSLTNSVTVKNHFLGKGIETVYYNSSYSKVQNQTIMENLVDYNTGVKVFNQAVADPNIVRGTGAADHIVASSNGQVLKGGKGDDIYYIDAKTDVIVEDTAHSTFWGDRIFFDDNNGGANVYTYTKEGNNLKIEFDDGSGAVVASAIVKNFYLRSSAQIERVGADDDGDISAGVAYDATSVATICDKVAALTSATKFLRGSTTDDQLTVAAGQRAYGLAGDDEYTVAAGKATIVDSAGTADVLNADHVATENDGVFIKRGNDLVILDGGDAVTGYADADAAIADLPNLSNAQKRTVLRNLLKMSDSITVKNYFSSGEIETINALNNNEITKQEIMTNVINYHTGLKFFNQDATTTSINGTRGGDYIVVTADNQKLYGGYGDDIYAVPGGMTNVEIYDTNGDLDKVVFTDADLDGADSYDIAQVGNDLKISVTDAGEGDSSVIIKDYYKTNKDTINVMEDFDGWTAIDLNNNWDFYSYGTTGNDTITGVYGKDNNMRGKAGDDSITGANSNDWIRGEDGNDTLNGGSATYNDYLLGGEGSDVYEFLSRDQNDRIYEEDATADDTDKVVFLGADFSLATSSITLTRSGNNLVIEVDEGDGIISNVTSSNYYAGGSSQIEVIEDQYGNSVDISAGTITGTVNAAIIYTGDNNAANYTAPDVDTVMTGGSGGDTFIGGAGDDSISCGDGADLVMGAAGDDWIDGGPGNDPIIDAGTGNDTIQGGLGNDGITPGADNDVILYDLDSGNAGGTDNITAFAIGEDVIRFTTSATGPMATYYRDQIAIWASSDAGNTNMQIGYGWDEATQSYANTIVLLGYDATSETDATVIEFITGDATYTLTDTEIETLLDEIVTGDPSANLTAVHDDGADVLGQQLQMIAAAW